MYCISTPLLTQNLRIANTHTVKYHTTIKKNRIYIKNTNNKKKLIIVCSCHPLSTFLHNKLFTTHFKPVILSFVSIELRILSSPIFTKSMILRVGFVRVSLSSQLVVLIMLNLKF